VANAAQATLSWTAPTTNADGSSLTDLAGYKFYVGNASGSYQQCIDVGNLNSYTLNTLNDGATYYFAVTAYNSTGLEGNYSNEVSKSFPPLQVSHLVAATFGSGGTITALNNANISQVSDGTTTLLSVIVNDGSSQSFNIAATAGYQVVNVAVDNVSIGPVTTYRFSNITANHTITATFAPLASFTITASAGIGGTITPAGTATFNSGASQTYTITANTGYAISDVRVDGISVGPVTSYSFNNITANHTIAATFAPVGSFTITASAGTGGSITPTGTATFNSGASQTYTIAANTGYATSDVKVDGVSVGPVTSYTFTNITANHTIAATFAPLSFTITASAGAGGSIAPSGTTTFSYGASQTYFIAASTGYIVSDVQVDGVSVGPVASYNFSNITANHTIAATFAPLANFTITASAGAGGSIAPSGTSTFNSGASQTYTIAANTGYAISDVKVDGVSVGPVASYSFNNIAANHTIAATFTPLSFTIIASTGTGGSIAPSGTSTFNYGASQTYTIAANTGYAIADVKVDGVSVGPVASYSFNNITANHTIAATFAPLSFTITASAGTGGSINPSGTGTYNYGASQTYAIAANTGYAIADVKVDGVSVGPVASYSFSNITANHTIAATFAPLGTFTITASAGTGGSITPSGTTTFNSGASQTYAIAANTGYSTSDVKVDGVSVGPVASYTFNNITANHTIAATFASSAVPDMTITKSHKNNFRHGQTGATYTITARNSGTASTTGTVTVIDQLPSGLSATAISGSGWACTLSTLTCTRSSILAAGSNYPSITLTVNVSNNAPSSVTNTASVSGGGEINTSNNTASDPTTIR